MEITPRPCAASLQKAQFSPRGWNNRLIWILPHNNSQQLGLKPSRKLLLKDYFNYFFFFMYENAIGEERITKLCTYKLQ